MDLLAFVLCLFVFLFWALLLTYKFYHFGYYDWDLAYFAQGMWNLCHGSVQVTVFGTNFFSNHANLIAYLILPIYKVFPHPLTLVYLKIASIVMAAFVLYVMAKEKLDPKTAILVLFLYLIYAPNIFGVIYEFDFESLAPVFLMLILYFYVKERWLGFLSCAAILVLIKENMPFIILAFSIHGLFTKKDKIRFGVIPGIFALISFYLLVYVFIPYMANLPIGKQIPFYYLGDNYKDMGGSASGIISSMIFHPFKTLHYLMTPLNFGFLVAIFNPLMYLSLGSPGILFLISPVFLQHLLSASVTEHEIRFAYVLTMAPFLFLAAVETLRLLYKNFRKEYYLTLVLLVIVNAVILTINFHVFKERFVGKEAWQETKEDVQDQWKLVHLIPPEASVVASFSFLAPLSQRADLYTFYHMYDPKYQNDQWSYQLPSNVRYALIDRLDPWLLKEDNYPLAQERVRKFFNSGGWKVHKKYGRFCLYEREAR